MDVHEYSSPHTQKTLCWDCSNATGGCKWSAEEKRVDGWKIKRENEGITVVECPEFDRDAWGSGLYRDGNEYARIVANRSKKHTSTLGRPKKVQSTNDVDTMYNLLIGGK